jgi:steroid delta-isomerase-like uncharacterized protein
MSLEENKTLVRRYVVDLWGKGDLAVADEILAEDYVSYGIGGRRKKDRKEEKQQVADSVTAFPDFEFTHLDIIAEGDWVATRWKVTGTHRGEAFGIPPTNKPITYTGMNFFRVAGGKLVEGHTEIAASLIIRQLQEAAQEMHGGE